MTITLTREEAQSVLDALADAAGCVQENYQPGHMGHGWGKEIETLRARLSAPECVCGEPNTAGVHRQDGPCYQQPEPEPVAWMYDFPNPDNPREDMVRDWVAHSLEEVERCRGFNVHPLYTAPPQREWQGLTDEEILPDGDSVVHSYDGLVQFARAIEAKLKGKNT